MDRALAERRGLECEVMDDRCGGSPPEDTITLGLGGAGAYALLAGEAGLHHFSFRRAGGPRPEKRELVRVDVLRAPGTDEALPRPDVRTEARPCGTEPAGVSRAGPLVELRRLHVPTMTSVVAWSERHETGPLEAWLRARVDGAGTPRYEAATVRRYRLGSAPLVRDRRTGRSTGNVDRVLRSELEPFLTPARRPR